jgi:hypothetical protein
MPRTTCSDWKVYATKLVQFLSFIIYMNVWFHWFTTTWNTHISNNKFFPIVKTTKNTQV